MTCRPKAKRGRAYLASPTPVGLLAEALGLSVKVEAVATVAAAYHPHLPAGPEHDAAGAELVEACGGVADEATAALVQVARGRDADPGEAIRRALAEDPPLRSTHRVHNGETIEVDISEFPFGAGPHACPGREHGIAIAAEILTGEAG